jgi:GT2 family glycosyltransferase
MRFLTASNYALALLGRSRRRQVEISKDSDEIVEVDWLRGSALMVRADVFRALGGFDEGFPLYEEDEDWCWRARRRGYRVALHTGVRATEAGGGSLDNDAWMNTELYRAHLRFLARRAGASRVLLYRFGVSAALLVKVAATRLRTLRTGAGERPATLALLRPLWTAPGKAAVTR